MAIEGLELLSGEGSEGSGGGERKKKRKKERRKEEQEELELFKENELLVGAGRPGQLNGGGLGNRGAEVEEVCDEASSDSPSPVYSDAATAPFIVPNETETPDRDTDVGADKQHAGDSVAESPKAAKLARIRSA